jgi:hypothetical protein
MDHHGARGGGGGSPKMFLNLFAHFGIGKHEPEQILELQSGAHNVD